MKNFLIGLLFAAAAGTGIYFLFFNKNKTAHQTAYNKELIIGKWKPSPNQPIIDTTAPWYQYNFQTEGILYRSVDDTTKADTLQYSWAKTGELVIKRSATDTLAHSYNIILLNTDTLQLRKADDRYTINLQKAK
jgi:hypothetical protein